MTKNRKYDGRKTTATVRPHPMHEGCWVGTVETPRGMVYSCTWRREEPPTAAEVLEVWRTERQAFNPGEM